jgi:hypothetical protein
MVKENTKDKLNNLPACAADFIKQVIKKMRYRRKIRRDVQAELTVHFEDELKDCKSDSEKEQKAEKLIAEFGDVKLLAVLLRRAKKRCRPIWRTIAARTFQTVCVLILCLIVYVVWFLSGRPVISTDYLSQLNQIVRPTADEQLNAEPLYDQAIQLIKNIDPNVRTILGNGFNQSTSVEKELAAGWMADNERLFQIIITAASRPYYWRTYQTKDGTSEMMGVLIPDLQEYKRFAYALRCRAWTAADIGRYEDSFIDLVACYQLGRHLKTSATSVEQLVGISIEGMAVDGIRHILDGYKINTDTLTDLQKKLEQSVKDEQFTLNLEGEKFCSYDVIQRTFTDGFDGGHIIPRQLAAFSPEVRVMIPANSTLQPVPINTNKPNLLTDFFSDIIDAAFPIKKFITTNGYILFFHPNKKQTLQEVSQCYDYMEQIKFKTPAQLRNEGISIEQKFMEIVHGNFLLQQTVPALDHVNLINYRNKTDVEATLTVIAINRFKQDKGQYPKDLEQLVTTGYLNQVPIDPFSDNPLVYKKTDDNFILYSFGLNFTDDGGQAGKGSRSEPRLWSPNGDAVFWPVQ